MMSGASSLVEGCVLVCQCRQSLLRRDPSNSKPRSTTQTGGKVVTRDELVAALRAATDGNHSEISQRTDVKELKYL
jgi:hypothetical protein